MAAIIGGNDSGVLDGSLTLLDRTDTTRDGVEGHDENLFVNVSNGNLVVSHTDAYLPSQGEDYAVVRTYNSRGNWNDGVGLGWVISTPITLSDMNANFINVRNSDGSEYRFDKVTTGVFHSTDGAGAYEDITYDKGAKTYTLIRSDQTRLEFDVNGTLQKSTDTNGNTIIYGYDSEKLLTVTDDTGHTITYEYGGTQGTDLARIVDSEAGVLVEYFYDQGLLIEVKDRNGDSTFYEYATDGTLRFIRLPHDPAISADIGKERVIEFTFEPDDVTSQLVLRKLIDAEGNTTEFNYNFQEDNTSKYIGGATVIVNALGVDRYRSNDAEYKEWRVANGYYETWDFVAYETSRLGTDKTLYNQTQDIMFDNSMQYFYDANGQLRLVGTAKDIGVYGPVDYAYGTLYTYNDKGDLTEVVDDNGYAITHSDDQYWRDLRRDYGYVNVTGEGMTIAELLAARDASTTGYDPLAELQELYTTHLEYDLEGNLTKRIDNNDNVTTYTYTAFNKIESQTSAMGNALISSDELIYQEKRQQLGYSATLADLTALDIQALKDLYTTTFSYDARQNVTQIVNPGNDITRFEYDTFGNVTKKIVFLDDADLITASKQQVTEYFYDAYGNNIKTIEADAWSITNSDDAYWLNMRKEFGIVGADGEGKLVADMTQLEKDSLITHYTSHSTYDLFGNKLTHVDPEGGVTTFTYDGDNRVKTVEDPEKNITVFTYDSVGNRIEVRDATGHPVIYVYDRNNMLIAKQDWKTTDGSGAQDRTTRYEYDVIGNRTAVIDAEGNKTTYVYREDSRLIEVISPQVVGVNGALVNYSTSFDYDALGNRISINDNNGNLTEYVYNQNGLLKQTTNAIGNVTTITYDANLNQVQILIGAQMAETQRRVLNFRFDEENQLIAEIDAQGELTQYDYDATGNLISVLDANGEKVISSDEAYYRDIRQSHGFVDVNGEGKLVADLTQLEKETLQAIFTSTFEYDLSNNLIKEHSSQVKDTVTGELVSNTVVHYFDGNRNQITNVDGNGNATHVSYDENNQAVMIEDANGVKTVYTYDEKNNRTAVYVGVEAHIDTNGNVVIDSELNAQVTRFTYDEFNQIETRLDGVGSALLSSDSVLYRELRKDMGIVDLAGEGKLVADLTTGEIAQIKGAHTERYTYDRLASQISAADNLGRTSSATYDALNRLESNTDAQGEVTRYTYDGNGNRVAVTNALANALITSDESVYQQQRIQLGYSATAAGLSVADKAAITELYTSHFSYDANNRLVDTTDTQDVVTHREYDNVGNLLTQTAAYGTDEARVGEFVYDLNNRLLQTTDPELNTNSYEYDAVGNRLQVVDGRTNGTSYVYNSLNQTIKVIDPLNFETKFEYDAVGNRLAILDARGGITQFDYDPGNRLISTTDAEGRTSTYSYDARNNRIALVDGNGNAIVSSDDAHWIAIRAENGIVDINGAGKLAADLTALEQQTLQALHTTSFEYDAENNLRAVVDAEGNRSENDYDTVYNLTASTDANGFTTQYSFDAVNRVIDVTDAEGGKTSYTYDAAGNRLSLTNANGHAVITQDDAYNLSVRQQLGFVDINGDAILAANLTQVQKDALLETFTAHYEYDNRQQLIKEISNDDTVTAYQYDKTGNSTSVTLAYGTVEAQTTTYVYDKNDRLIEQTNAIGNGLISSDTTEYRELRTSLGYTAELALLTAAEKDELLALYTSKTAYDENGNAVRTTDALGRATEYVYDANNRVTDIIDATGIALVESDSQYYQDLRTGMGYAALVANLAATDVTALKAAHTTSYVYDSVGNRVQVVNALGYDSTSYYNLNGEVTHVVNALGNAMAFSYDANGNQISATSYKLTVVKPADLSVLPTFSDNVEDQITRFAYDGVNRVTRTINAEGYVVDTAYDAAGNVKSNTSFATAVIYDAGASLNKQQITLNENDRLVSYGYDNTNRLVQTADAEGYVTTYTYDALGNQLTVTGGQYVGIDIVKQNSQHIVTLTNAYDEMNRLVSQKNGLGIETTFEYDAVGNRTQMTEAAGTADRRITAYEFDDVNQMVSEINAELTVTRFIYDAAGQVTEQHVGYGRDGTDGRGATQSLYNSYDALGNVIKMVTPDGIATEYEYDSLGNIVKQVNAAGSSNGGESITTFRYDKLNRVDQKIIAAGTAEAETTGYGYDAFGNLFFEVMNDNGNVRYNVNYYDKNNHLVRQINAENVETGFTYDAYGNVLTRSITDKTSFDTQTTSFEYDGRDLLVRTENGELEAVKNAYDAVGNLLTETRGFGTLDAATTVYQYDLANRLTDQTIDPGAPASPVTTHYVYDNRGNLTTEVDAYQTLEERSITTVYDDMNRATVVTDGEGFATTFAYDVFGNQISVTTGQYFGADAVKSVLAFEATTRFAYDQMNRQVFQVDSLGVVTKFAYDDRGNKTSEINAYGYLAANQLVNEGNVIALAGSPATTTLDDQLRLASTEARTSTFVFNAANRMTDEIQPEGTVVHYEYNMFGDLNSKTVDYGVGDQFMNATTSYVYDGAGRITFEIDAVNSVSHFVYDDFGNVITETRGLALDASGNPSLAVTPDIRVTEYTYDLTNRLLTETIDPQGLIIKTEFVYDERGNQIKIIDANGNAGESVYDKADRLIWQRNAEGSLVTFEYNARGNTIGETRYATQDKALALGANPLVNSDKDQTTSYEYDMNDRLVLRTDSRGVENTLSYDAIGNVVKDVQNQNGILSSDSRTMEYSYNLANLVINETAPSGMVTSYSYDAMYNVAEKVVENNYLDTLNLDVNGNPTPVTELQTSTFSYNLNNLMTDMVVDPDGLGLHTSYRYNSLGNTIAETSPNAYAVITEDTLWAKGIREDLGIVDINGDAVLAAALDVTQIQSIRDAFTTRTYFDDAGRAIFTVDQLGHVSEVRYDAVGNKVKAITYANAVDTSLLNDYTNPAVIEDPANDRIIDFVFDKANQETGFKLPAIEVYVLNAEGIYEKVSVQPENLKVYDGVGNVTRETDANGNTTYNYYDSNAQLTGRIDAEGYLVKYTNDAFGNVLSQEVYQQQQDLTQTQKETLNVSAYVATGLSRVIDHEYDDANNEIKTLLPASDLYINGVLTTEQVEIDRTFDAFGLMLTESVMHAVSNVTPAYTSYSYDSAGRLTSEVDARVVTLLNSDSSYSVEQRQQLGFIDVDGSGKLVANLSADDVAAIKALYTKSYSYDAVNNMRDQNDAGRITTFEYDLANRAIFIHLPAFDRVDVNANGGITTTADFRFVSEMQYDAFGNLVHEVKPTGDDIYYQYDLANRKTAAIDQNGVFVEYGYNFAGDRTLVNRYFNIVADPSGANAAELFANADKPIANANDQKIVFEVDKLGRVVKEHQYGAPNINGVNDDRITTMGYDANGNQVQIVGPRGFTTTLFFDSLNRVIGTVNPAGGLSSSVFDAQGNVITQQTGGMTAPTLIDNTVHQSYASSEGVYLEWATSTSTNANVYVGVKDTPVGTWVKYTAGEDAFEVDHGLLINGLNPQTEYEYYVVVGDAFGNTVTTDIKSFVTTANVEALTVSNVSGDAVNGYTATIAFSQASSLQGLELVVGEFGADVFNLEASTSFIPVLQPDGSYITEINFSTDPANTLFQLRWTDSSGFQYASAPDLIQQKHVLREFSGSVVTTSGTVLGSNDLTVNWELPKEEVETYIDEVTGETKYNIFIGYTIFGVADQSPLTQEATLNADGTFSTTFTDLKDADRVMQFFYVDKATGTVVEGTTIRIPTALTGLDQRYQRLTLDFPDVDTTDKEIQFSYRAAGTTDSWVSLPATAIHDLSVDLLGITEGNYEFKADLLDAGAIERTSQGTFNLREPGALSNLLDKPQLTNVSGIGSYTMDGTVLGMASLLPLNAGESISIQITDSSNVTSTYAFNSANINLAFLSAGDYSILVTKVHSDDVTTTTLNTVSADLKINPPVTYVATDNQLSFPGELPLLAGETLTLNITDSLNVTTTFAFNTASFDMNQLDPGDYSLQVVKTYNNGVTTVVTGEITGNITINPLAISDSAVTALSASRDIVSYNLTESKDDIFIVNVAKATQTEDHVFTLYNETGQKIYSNENGGAWTRYFHDAQGNVTREVTFRYMVPDSSPAQFLDTVPVLGTAPSEAQLDANYLAAVAAHDPENGVDTIRDMTRAYDVAGNKIQETVNASALANSAASNSVTSQWHYDLLGNTTHEITAKGLTGEELTTSYTFDAMNRMTSLTYNSMQYHEDGTPQYLAAKQNVTYDIYGNRSSQTNERDFTELFYYDDQNRLASQWSATSVNFDTLSVGARSLQTDYAYDAFERVTTKTETDLTKVVGAENRIHTTSFEYNNYDQQTKRTSQLTANTDAVVTMTYDKSGNKITETDASNHTQTFKYDAENRVIKRTDRMGGVWTTAYDAYGNKVSEVDANRRVTRYNIGAYSQIDSKTETLTHNVIVDRPNILTAEQEAQLEALREAQGNGDGFLAQLGPYLFLRKLGVAKTYNVTSGRTSSYTETSNYNWNGKLSSVTDTFGKNIHYAYDDADRMTSINDITNNQVSDYTYDARGNRITETLTTNGSLLKDQSYTYNQRSWLTGMNSSLSLSSAGVLLSQDVNTTYQFDAAGNRTRSGNSVGEYKLFNFDSANRMLDINTLDNGSQVTLRSFTYDGFGNRIVDTFAKEENGNTTFKYDYAGRVTGSFQGTVQKQEWRYDDNGNATYHRQSNGDTTETTYDAESRSVTTNAKVGSDVTKTRMFYDAAGNLGVMRVDASDYGFDEVSRYDVRYDTHTKNIENSWVKKAKYLYGTSNLKYNSNGQLIEVDKGRKKGELENTVSSFSYDNDGHVIGRSDRAGLDTQVGELRGYFKDPDTTQYGDEEDYGRSYTLTEKLEEDLFLGDTSADLGIHGYVFANGNQMAEANLSHSLSLTKMTLNPAQSYNTYDSDSEVSGVATRLTAGDIVKNPDGSVNREATARNIATRIYPEFAGLSTTGQSHIVNHLAQKLSTLTDAQIVVDASLTVDRFILIADGDVTKQEVISDYSVQNIDKDGIPGGVASTHTIAPGESLQSISSAYFGNPNYWFLIAEANGLNGTEELVAGTTLVIPNVVSGALNDKDGYKVYSESDIIGSTSPEVLVKKKKKSFFQKLVTIIIIVIIIYVAWYVAEYAAAAYAAAGGAAASVGALALVALEVAVVGYAAGVATSFVTQGLAIMADLQDGFDWKAMRDMGKDFAITAVAAFAGAWAKGAELAAGNEALVRGGIAVAEQYARDGEITSVSGILVSMAPGLGKFAGENNWTQTAKVFNTIDKNSKVASVGLGILEKSIKGESVNSLDWINLAAAVITNGIQTAGNENVKPDIFGGVNGGTTLNANGSIDWQKMGQNALVTAGLSLIVGSRRGEDAALNFIGQSLGNNLVAALGEQSAFVKAQKINTRAEASEQKVSADAGAMSSGGGANAAALSNANSKAANNATSIPTAAANDSANPVPVAEAPAKGASVPSVAAEIPDPLVAGRAAIQEVLDQYLTNYKSSEAGAQATWDQLNALEKIIVPIGGFFDGAIDGVVGLVKLAGTIAEGGVDLAIAAAGAQGEILDFGINLTKAIAAEDWPLVQQQLTGAKEQFEGVLNGLGESGKQFLDGLDTFATVLGDEQVQSMMGQFVSDVWDSTSTGTAAIKTTGLIFDIILAVGTGGAFAAGKGAATGGKVAGTLSNIGDKFKDFGAILAGVGRKGPDATGAANGPNRIYSARELNRRVEEPGPFHNFPEAINDDIFSGTRTVVSDDYVLYTEPGSLTLPGQPIFGTRQTSIGDNLNNPSGNKTREIVGYTPPRIVEGQFEIGVRPSESGRTEVITHRFFRENEF